MKKGLQITGITLGAALLAALVFGAGWYLGKLPAQEQEIAALIPSETQPVEPPEVTEAPAPEEAPPITQEEVAARLEKLADFVPYSGSYTITRSADSTRYLLEDYAIPGTTNSITICCTGVVEVGYDVGAIVPQVDNEAKTILVTLPQPKLLRNFVIWDSVEIQETDSLLNPIQFQQYRDLIGEIEAEGLAKLEREGIYQASREQLQLLIGSLLAVFPHHAVVFQDGVCV